MEDLKLKTNVKLVDTTLDALSIKDLSSLTHSTSFNGGKRGPMSMRSYTVNNNNNGNSVKDALGRKLLKNIKERQ